MLKETAAALGVALALARGAAAQDPPPPATPPDIPEAQIEELPSSVQIRCETSCSETEPGVVLA